MSHKYTDLSKLTTSTSIPKGKHPDYETISSGVDAKFNGASQDETRTGGGSDNSENGTERRNRRLRNIGIAGIGALTLLGTFAVLVDAGVRSGVISAIYPEQHSVPSVSAILNGTELDMQGMEIACWQLHRGMMDPPTSTAYDRCEELHQKDPVAFPTSREDD